MPSTASVATYDLKPEMSAREVTDGVVDGDRVGRRYDFILVNFANPDMVGHTGMLAGGDRGGRDGRRLPRPHRRRRARRAAAA